MSACQEKPNQNGNRSDSKVGSPEVVEVLAKFRQQLLDVSTRNPLISLAHGRSSKYLRLANVSPNRLAEQLFNQKYLLFAPVPIPSRFSPELADGIRQDASKANRPTVDDWAKIRGINLSPDLPREFPGLGQTRQSRDLRVQTPYDPDVLEARLAGISKLARTTVEETGSNFLHLAIGFLEWYEDDESDTARHAPLYVVSVNLEKGELDDETRTYQYRLSLASEEVQHNASLEARLREDFGYSLPEITEEMEPEEYLDVVASSIRTKFPRWKVCRWATITMLNFSKLLMFKDLDPINWPKDRSLARHKLVSDVITGEARGRDGTGGLSTSGIMVEYEIDKIHNIHERFPLVDVADSSQHSALIDALNGKDLVIQGPPGTGKSQTITNLIAAALNMGKTVLFVSEKLAALDVVSNRMRQLGLNSFCLELHSHTTQKMSVIESLRRRLETEYPDPKQLDVHITRHNELRNLLANHCQRVNKPWHNTGKTIHEILTAAVRFKDGLPHELEDIRLAPFLPEMWDALMYADGLSRVRVFHLQVRKISSDIRSTNILKDYPWRGFTKVDLDADARSLVLSALSKWRDSLQNIEVHAAAFAGEASAFPQHATAKEMAMWAEIALNSPEYSAEVFWDSLNALRQARFFVALKMELEEIERLAAQVRDTGRLDYEQLQAFADLDALTSIVNAFWDSNLRPDLRVEDLIKMPECCRAAEAVAKTWKTYLAEFAHNTPTPMPKFMQEERLSIGNLRLLDMVVTAAEQLPVPLHENRNSQLLTSQLGSQFDDFRAQVIDLQMQRSQLSQQFNLAAVKSIPDLDGLTAQVPPLPMLKRLFNGSYRQAMRVLRQLLVDPKKRWQPKFVQKDLQRLIGYLRHEVEFSNTPLWKELFGNLFLGVDTNLDQLEKLVEWHSRIEPMFGIYEGGLFRKWTLGEAGQWLLDAPFKIFQQLPFLANAGIKDAIQNLETVWAWVASAYGHREIPADALLCSAEDPWVGGMRLIQQYAGRLAGLQSVLRSCEEATLSQARDALARYNQFLREIQETQVRYMNLNDEAFGGNLPGLPYPTARVIELLIPTREWVAWLCNPATPQPCVARILDQPSVESAASIQEWGTQMSLLVAIELQARNEFCKVGNIDKKKWIVDQSIHEAIDRANNALSTVDLLPDYMSFLNQRNWLHDYGLKSLADDIESHQRSAEHCVLAYEHAVHASHAQYIFKQEDMLRRFNVISHTDAQRAFIETDKMIQQLMRRKIATHIGSRTPPNGIRGVRVSEHTELELLYNEIAKQRRHIPIRQLLLRAGKAIQVLKPCFMMGPRSVAQFLAPEGLSFDLLVIDEASQMRPSDALGAVARCKQMVVVGDSKQLAPTTFFDQVVSDEDPEDEQFEASNAESILDAVMPIFTTRHLRWHYRSKHESLIAFSNHNFYDSNLMLFPSPRAEHDSLGVRFVHIPNGEFENQSNRPEALRVVQRVEELLLDNPELSMGIATMNAKQRDLIERLIEDRTKSNACFGEALANNGAIPEPLFIKNLENVQGDERDVILISCTYGRDATSGKIYHRFGPINGELGWRRLNVLFTRSRVRMEIFSSMVSADILTTDSSSKGMRAFKGMLHYAETKRLHFDRPSGKSPDSDFEIAVANLLSAHGFETDCQVGVSGFFIDLAVKCPHVAGTYVMGIECDGASYHSGKSVRDRDRLRQEILESLGWKIRRIWSTDWFENPPKALRPILDELKRLPGQVSNLQQNSDHHLNCPQTGAK